MGRTRRNSADDIGLLVCDRDGPSRASPLESTPLRSQTIGPASPRPYRHPGCASSTAALRKLGSMFINNLFLSSAKSSVHCGATSARFTNPRPQNICRRVRILANDVVRSSFTEFPFSTAASADPLALPHRRFRLGLRLIRLQRQCKPAEAEAPAASPGLPFTTDRSTSKLNIATPSIASVFQYRPVQAHGLLAIEGGSIVGAGSESSTTTRTCLYVFSPLFACRISSGSTMFSTFGTTSFCTVVKSSGFGGRRRRWVPALPQAFQ